MLKEIQAPYSYERSLVSGRALWLVPHEEVEAQALNHLPQMYSEVFHWTVLRPTISSLQLVTLHGQSNQLPQDSLYDTERSFIAAARREAGEFTRESLFGGSSVVQIQSELGDIMFFLLIPSINFDLKESAANWLDRYEFDATDHDQQRELTNQPGEKVVESAVALLDETLGYGSSALAVNSQAVGRALGLSYGVIFRYAIAAGWDLGDILHKTRLKNDHNYPDLFFTNSSPFPYFQDAIDCLRMFRSAIHPSGNSYLTVFYERFGEPISWVSHDIDPKEFREFIFSALDQIAKESPVEVYKQIARNLLFDYQSREIHRQTIARSRTIK